MPWRLPWIPSMGTVTLLLFTDFPESLLERQDSVRGSVPRQGRRLSFSTNTRPRGTDHIQQPSRRFHSDSEERRMFQGISAPPCAHFLTSPPHNRTRKGGGGGNFPRRSNCKPPVQTSEPSLKLVSPEAVNWKQTG